MELRKAGSGLWNFLIELQSNLAKNQRIYILPTGFGLAFAVMILVLFFLAAGYGNNLVFLVVFFLISICVTIVYWTNRNVDKTRIEAVQGVSGFAGEGCTVQVRIKNKSARVPAESLRCLYTLEKSKSLAVDNIVIPPGKTAVLGFQVVYSRRGRQFLPRITLESQFPVGLLRAWKVFQDTAKIVVYPERNGTSQFPQEEQGREQLQIAGVFRDHRLFQSADPVSRIDWRASARRQELLVKNFEEPQQSALHFTWEQTEHLSDFEARISQLALWVDRAEKSHQVYSLQLGSEFMEAGRGPLHWQRCLEALALLQEEDVAR